MKDQGDLFPPFAKGSDTSREAAESVAELTGKMRVRVYRVIADRGSNGATCDEVEQWLNLPHQTASARCNELRNQGWIEDSEQRRKTRSGRNACVWTVTGKKLES